MKIGTLDIKKAYLGVLELTHSNAFIGTYPVIPASASYAGLKMTSTGNSTVSFNYGATSYKAPDLKYSLNNGSTWTQWDFSAISLTDGQTVCFKGNNSCISYAYNQYNKFVMTGSIAASGNIMSILDDGACTRTNVTYSCFLGLFFGCTSLTTAPELPATTLNQYCYRDMFYGCTSLTTAPELPALTLSNYCYQTMFQGCTSLTTAPNLPATSLTTACYNSMFYNCSSLTTAPELPATILVANCYNGMFYNCSSLNYVKCLATDLTAVSSSALNYWLDGVSQTGTFIQAVGAKFAPGSSGIPFGWTTQDSNGILGFKYVEQKVARAATEADLELPSKLDTYIFAVYGQDDNLRVITTTLTSAAGLSVTYPVGSYETMSYTTNSSGMKEIEESEVLRVSKARIGSSEYDAKPFIAQCIYVSSNVRFRNVNNTNQYLQMGGQNILNFGSAGAYWEYFASPKDGYYYNVIRWTSTGYGNNRYLKQSTIISPTDGDCSLNVGSDYSSSSIINSHTPRYYKRVSYYVS